MKRVITNNEKETFDFGAALGRQCRPGEVFALCGELGAGKTKLAQGLAKGLGVKGRVNSPTFNILKIYKIKKSILDKSGAKNGKINGEVQKNKIKFFCHIDAYRLKSEKNLVALGAKEFFSSPDTITAIEWAEKVKGVWPKKVRVIRIKQIKNGRGRGVDKREIIF